MTAQDARPLNYVTSPHLKNELDEFTSYSYHFVMSVTDTSTAIGKMLDQSNAPAGPSGQNGYLSRVLTTKRPGEVIDLGDGDRSWLIMDTRRFSEYQVIALDTKHVYGAGSSDNPSAPAGTVNVQVVDTTGMSFFNMLLTLFQSEIKSARLSCFFLISIVFVGHRPDGSIENTVVATCHIPAILMLMQFSVDHRGSIYDMVFMENDAGVIEGSNMEMANSLGSVQSISTETFGTAASSKLGDLMQALEDALNRSSVEFYKSYRNAAIAAAESDGVTNDSTTVNVPGKMVQYMITVPDEWKEFACKQATKSENITQLHTVGGIAENASSEERAEFVDKVQIEEDSASSVSMTFAPTTTITQAVSHILMSCLDVLKLASAEKRQNGEATLFKTALNITSDKTTYVVHVDVFPYRFPKSESLAGAAPANGSSTIDPNNSTNISAGSETPKNLLVYDYIFTGQNSHILDLAIKYMPESVIAFDTGIETGKNRMARASAVGNSQTNIQEAANPSPRPANSATFAPTLRPNDPILPGLRSTSQQTNNGGVFNESTDKEHAAEQVRATNEFVLSQAYLHFVSSMNLSMTIRGNPNLLRKHADRKTKGGQPPHPRILDATRLQSINASTANADEIFANIIQQPLRSAKDAYYSTYVKPKIESALSSNSPDGPDLMASPLFFKINIKSPNIDYKTGNFTTGLTDDGQREPLYTDKFFFDGPYISTLVTTTFQGGSFTHTVDMIPYVLTSQSPIGKSGT